MKKLYWVVAAVVLSGFLTTLGMGMIKPSIDLSSLPESFRLCASPFEIDNAMAVNQDVMRRIGFPLRATIRDSQSYSPCADIASIPDEGFLSVSKAYVKSPVFYLNWAILTLPYAVLAYVFFGRRWLDKHENSRH